MSVAREAGRSPVVRWTAHGVTIRKVVEADGRFQMQIQAGADQVILAYDPGVLTVSRNDRTAVVHLANPDEEAFDQARTMLAESKAVRQFRAMAYGLSAAESSSPAGASLQVTATFLSLLDGDIGAAERLVNRGARRGPGPLAGFAIKGSDEEERLDQTCYARYRDEVVAAWSDFEGCCLSFGYWQPMVQLCAFEWALRVESAWFGFLGCSSIPVK